PSPADIKDMGEIVDLIHGKTKAAFLLTRTRKGDDLVDLVRNALSEFPFPVLENTIRDLKGFRASFGAGQTVFEFRDYKSAQEDVETVANEILEMIQNGAED